MEMIAQGRPRLWLKRLAVRLSFGRQYQLKDFYLRWRFAARNRFRPPVKEEGRTASLRAHSCSREYSVALPDGFGAKQISVRVSIPQMPAPAGYSFAEHVTDANGAATDRVIARATGALALSEDLGRTWNALKLQDFARFPIMHAKRLPNGEFLLQAVDPDNTASGKLRHYLLVANTDGEILSHIHVDGAYWHGPRSVDVCGGTIMYAEYVPNRSKQYASVPTMPSRVWRSRDLGRSWQIVFQTSDIRHFHFLQARPGRAGEWWLTSGDRETESRIWKSTDDGDSWLDLTSGFPFSFDIGSLSVSRRVFRLTDLVWAGDDILWGADDPITKIGTREKGAPQPPAGARAFRWNPASGKGPEVLGLCGPPVRNIVALKRHYVLITQAAPPPDETCPRVLLIPKRSISERQPVVPLFEIDKFSRKRPAFTYSRASRAAKDGVFFTSRTAEDIFDHPNRILKWEVQFD